VVSVMSCTGTGLEIPDFKNQGSFFNKTIIHKAFRGGKKKNPHQKR
jgi:hypothetical protein